VARAGSVAEIRSNNEHTTRSLDGLPSLVPLSAFATDIFPKLQADIRECANLFGFVNLVPTLSNRARLESRRFVSRLANGALTFLALDLPTMGRLGELGDKFHEHGDAVFRVVVCRIFGHPSSRILSTVRSPTACAFCHLSVQSMRGAFESAGIDMSNEAWVTDFAWLDAAEMLHSIPLTLGSWQPLRKSPLRSAAQSGSASRSYRTPRCNFNSPTAATAPLRRWVSCITSASEAQNLHLMPWYPVCSAFQPPISRRRSPPCLDDQVREELGGVEESPRHPLHSLCGHGIWYSRWPRHGFYDRVIQARSRL
jgi:hypothetical protein